MDNHSQYFFINTFGCKLNQYDSAAISSALFKNGWLETKNMAESHVFIINTCTVTDKSDRETIRLIHKIRKNFPDRPIALSGCLVETREMAQLQKELPEVNFFWGNVAKYDISKIISSIHDYYTFKETGRQMESMIPPAPTPANLISQLSIQELEKAEFLEPLEFSPNSQNHSRVRALVKIQDGCSNHCSYCIVPFARGKNRSVTPAIILNYLKNLQSKGFTEAVLTGIHIGTYGKDLKNNEDPKKKWSLLQLLKEIEACQLNIKLRLSSLDFNEITDELIDYIVSNRQIQPHLHIPLQSGSDSILKKMKRPSNTRQFIEKINTLAKLNPDMLLGTDIIVGFPGETEDDFKQTKRVLLESQLHYAHIFSFSPRQGTAAFHMDNQIPALVKKERHQILTDIVKLKRVEFLRNQVNKKRVAVILNSNTKSESNGLIGKLKNPGQKYSILTDNYLKLDLITHHKNLSPGNELMIKINSFDDNFYAVPDSL